MFERFTKSARDVVVNAEREAETLGHDYIGTEHLLLALLYPSSGGAHTMLAEAGLEADRVRLDIVRLTEAGSSALSAEDAAALEAIGIDLDAVRAKVEESFGPGALRPSPTSARRWRFGRRDGANGFGHRRFSGRARKVLELALREALRLQHKFIGSEHILLGLIREGEGLAAKVMHDAGIDLNELRASTVASLKPAA